MQEDAMENSKSSEEKMRQGFKNFNQLMLLMWRLGLGPWINLFPDVVGRIMVITHTGRKTGKKYRTPVNYAMVGGDIFCVAGFGSISDWYRNLATNTEVEVWLPNGWWTGTAEELKNGELRLPLVRQVLVASGFASRFAGIDPKLASDESLSKATSSYHLFRIRLVAPRTGTGGPGDLAWVWPLSTLLLFMMLLTPRRRRR
jgi:deazaflavin-dependent oxidoreductase (nitroreductase family)